MMNHQKPAGLDDDRIRVAADLLFAARSSSARLSALPASCRPATEADGYKIQARLIERCGGGVAGWKVGATARSAQRMLKTDRPFSGCLLRPNISRAFSDLSARVFHEPLIEAEYAFVMRAFSSDDGMDEASILAHVKALHLGIEICETRFSTLAGPGVPCIIADNAVASHFVLGPEVPHWTPRDLVVRDVSISVNHEARARGNGAAVLENPLRSLCWVIVDRKTRGELPTEDFIIATGSCTGMTPVARGDFIEARFDGLGVVDILL